MSFTSSAPYSQVRQYSVSLGVEQVDLVTKPGLPKWELVRPSTQLFLDQASIQPGDSLLLYGCHLGTLAAVLARKYPTIKITLTDHNHTSLEMARLTLAANHIDGVTFISAVELPAELQQSLDIIFIQLPKGRSLARRCLVQANLALHTGGSLYLAGANASGIQSVIKDAYSLFGNGRILAYKKGNRVAQFIKLSTKEPPPEWAQQPGIAPGTWVEFSIPFAGHNYLVRSLPGVFSSDRLDEGTQMLLQAVTIPKGAIVLDLGCGYGIIGTVAALYDAGSVHLTDNDLLAVAASQATLSLNKVSNGQVFTGDLCDPVRSNRYDLVLSNPPFHAGYGVDYQIAEALIGQSYQVLNPGGQLVMVANRFIRYDRLVASIFGNVSFLAESGKFHVLSGLKSMAEKPGIERSSNERNDDTNH